MSAMTLPAQLAVQVGQFALTLATARHGEKSALTEATASALGISRATLLRWVKEISVRNPRKRRSDAGKTSLTRDEAEVISAALMESFRKNGKQLLSIEQAIDMLRANELIRGEVIDPDSGEVRQLSTSTIARALRAYGLHPETLMRPAAAIALASKHPNHIWQIDASMCVLYYLRTTVGAKDAGLQVMDRDVFYKNKPANVERIVNDRVWRYAVTDHTSGYIYVEYVLGGETGANLVNVFINAIHKRDGEPVHGVPFGAMLDPGSANTGALFKNLCRALQVRVLINQVGSPRAKGQVENSHNLIERSFESGLKFVAVNSLDELNAAAARWRKWFNGTSVMSRHGMTRNQAWLRITADQLRIAPELAVCRELATSAPVERTVTDKLQVGFDGQTYDVSCVPDIQNGNKVLVCRNPWRPDAAQVVGIDADGREVYYVIEPVGKDDFGFDANAAVIGESYRRHADTPAQIAAKAIEKRAMGVDTLEAAAAARKGKKLAFGGTIDPWKHMEEAVAQLPSYIPKRGTALETPLPGIAAAPDSMIVPDRLRVEAERLGHVAMATRLAQLIAWSPDYYTQMVKRYPDGCLEEELHQVAKELLAGTSRQVAAA